MLTAKPSFERIALNRVTFGARDTDVASAEQTGFAGWVEDQLNAPTGDDAALDAFLKTQTMPVSYRKTNPDGTSSTVNEDRGLDYLYADTAELWGVLTGVNQGTVEQFEQIRIMQEMAAGHYIRNTHAKYQLREVLVDFWHNHFNVGRQESDMVSDMLPLYDRDAIRPHALGNFRQMLEAVATSASMLFFLDNAESNKNQPNENYARELLELHTLGIGAYLGVSDQTGGSGTQIGGNAPGYTDQDVIEASRALSGWTIEFGQRNSSGGYLPSTGNFIYNAAQHNTQAQKFLGIGLSGLTAPMQQGQMVLDICAYHESTADFVCRKLCVRLFGDAPPDAVVERAKAAWLANTQAPDQIALVLRAILLEGDEIGTVQQAKVRRPYERLIALLRTTDSVVNANATMKDWVSPMGDGLFVWPEPDGRPDDNTFWLTSVATLGTWNLLLQSTAVKQIQTSLYDQTPPEMLTSATQIADYWIERLIGYMPESAAYTGIMDYVAGPGGVMAALKTGNANLIEPAFRKLVGLIACTEEFAYR
ncbi:MAG: DUF1800 domain-containing protein [Rhodobacteraceae bacterium]|nr:DUF1800 domain-containing protein [Paracoccaceae bacterium]